MASCSTKANTRDPQSTKAKLKKYDSAYYTIYTDLEPDDVKETLICMTKMAEEYHEGWSSGSDEGDDD